MDNLTTITEPYNIMICPIIGDPRATKMQLQEETGATKQEEVIGVVQFLNKNERAHITEEEDVVRRLDTTNDLNYLGEIQGAK